MGDIIKVKDGEEMPADCVLLQVEEDQTECIVDLQAHDGFHRRQTKLVSPNIASNIHLLINPKKESLYPFFTLQSASSHGDL